MQGQSHNHNHNHQSQQSQPGDIEELDGWNWRCYCHDGPPSDWENDDRRMVCCGICHEVWCHVICHGYQYVYEKDEELWEDLLFACGGCSGADPTQEPSLYSHAPTNAPTTPIKHTITTLDNDDIDGDGHDCS